LGTHYLTVGTREGRSSRGVELCVKVVFVPSAILHNFWLNKSGKCENFLPNLAILGVSSAALAFFDLDTRVWCIGYILSPQRGVPTQGL
jgi:hypothetical protein